MAVASALLALSAPLLAASPELVPPQWAALSAQDREALAPLADEWDKLEDFRRRKWLGIAERYPRMSAEEQQRLHVRMKQWTGLTPAQRRQARERYRNVQNLHPEAREALKQQWFEYATLPEEERMRLIDAARPRRAERIPSAKPPAPLSLPATRQIPVPRMPAAAPAPAQPTPAAAPTPPAAEALAPTPATPGLPASSNTPAH